jgi:hypothetical protein
VASSYSAIGATGSARFNLMKSIACRNYTRLTVHVQFCNRHTKRAMPVPHCPYKKRVIQTVSYFSTPVMTTPRMKTFCAKKKMISGSTIAMSEVACTSSGF